MIADVAVGGKSDDLTLQADTTHSQFIINDPNAILGIVGTVTGATESVDDHTVYVPFAAVTGSQIQVNTGAGNDTLTVDDSLGVFSKVIVYNAGTHIATPTQSVSFAVGSATLGQTYAVGDTLNVNDGSDATPGTTFITSTAVERVGGDTILVSGIQTLNLTTGTAEETVSIFGTPASLTTITAHGDLFMQVSGTADFSSLVVNAAAGGFITAGVNSTGLGSLLQFNGGSAANTYVVFGTGQAAGLQLNGGSGNDVMYLLASASGSFLALNGGTGTDSFVITGSNGSVNGDLGTMAVNGQGGTTDQLVMNDSDATGTHTYTVQSTNVSRSGMGPLSYQGIGVLSILLGQGANTLQVYSEASGTVTVLYGEGGSDNDYVTVAQTSGYKNLVFMGGGGTETLHVLDGAGRSKYTPSTPPRQSGKKSGTVQVLPRGGVLSTIEFAAFDAILYS